jgi:hypothetical protein
MACDKIQQNEKDGYMEKITYKDAAALLGITIDSLRHGIMRGTLSRTTDGRTRYAKLIKEQVELFKGKCLAFKVLTDEEKQIWQWYDEQAARVFLPGVSTEISQAAIDAMVRRQVSEQMAAERERQGIAAASQAIQDVLFTPHQAAPENSEVPEVRPFYPRVRTLVKA